jgi:hypothetical protein
VPVAKRSKLVAAPTPSISREKNQGPKATFKVAPESWNFGIKLSKSLVNNLDKLTSRLAPDLETNRVRPRLSGYFRIWWFVRTSKKAVEFAGYVEY